MAQRYRYFAFTSDPDVIYQLQRRMRIILPVGGKDGSLTMETDYVTPPNDEETWRMTEAERKKHLYGHLEPSQAMAVIKKALPAIKKEGVRIRGSPSVEDVQNFDIKAIPAGINWAKTLSELISSPGAKVVYQIGDSAYQNDGREVISIGSVNFKEKFGAPVSMDGIGVEGDLPQYVALRTALRDQWNLYCSPKGNRAAGESTGGDAKRTKLTAVDDGDSE